MRGTRPFAYCRTTNRPCLLLSTHTLLHTSLNSLYVLVYYLCFLCRQKCFYHIWVDWKWNEKKKKCISKNATTLPRHHQRLHFYMRATFSHLLYVDVCLFACLCVCVCATSCWLHQSPNHVLLYPLFVPLLRAPFPFMALLFYFSFLNGWGAGTLSWTFLLVHVFSHGQCWQTRNSNLGTSSHQWAKLCFF